MTPAFRQEPATGAPRDEDGLPWLLGALIVQAATLFMFGVGRESLAGDELATLAGTLTDDSLRDVITTSAPYHNHPPLYYVLLWLWGKTLGVGEAVLRLPSALFMVGCVPLLYKMGQALAGRWAAVIACQLFVLSPVALRYAHEARPYALFSFLSLASLHLLLSILAATGPVRRRLYVFYGVVLFATCATHPYSIFVLLGHATVVCLYGSGRRTALAKTWLVTLGCLAPLVWSFVAGSTKMQSFLYHPEYVNMPTDPGLLDFLGLPFWLMFGDPAPSSLIATGLSVLAFLIVAPQFFRNAGGLVLGVGAQAIVFLGLPVLITMLWANIFAGRYFVAGLPIVALFGACVLARGIAGRRSATVICVLTLISMTPGVVRYHTTPDRTQWREAVSYIVREASETDGVILKGSSRIASQTAWDYYIRKTRLRVWTMRRTESGRLGNDVAAQVLESDPPPTVWMTKSGARADRAFVPEMEELLESYEFVEVAAFFGIEVYRGDRDPGNVATR